MPSRHLKLTLRNLILMFSLVSLPCLSQDLNARDVNQLKNLVDAKQFQEAHQLSSKLLADWGGDPAFDLLAGQAAYGAGYFQEAVFAFERVIITDPEVLTARVLLAFSYFQVKNYGAAKVELTKLLNEDLPPEDTQKVTEYLRIITEVAENAVRKTTLNFTMGFGYDTNVNSGTEEETINFPTPGEIEVLEIVLTDESRETEDNIGELALVYLYEEKLSQTSGYSLGATVSHVKHQDSSNLDRSTINLMASYNDVFSDTKFNIMGYFQPMILNDDYYRSAAGVMVDVSWNLSDQWIWLLGSGYAAINNVATDEQDMDQLSTRARLTYLGKHVHVLDLSFSDEDAKLLSGIYNGKDFWTLSYSWLWPVNPQWLLTLNAFYQDIEHDAEQPAFGVIRVEENYSLSLNIDYTPIQEWIVSARLNVSDKKSNVAIYDYDRSFAKLLVTYKF